ncbi:hypothetical protein EDC01DRAFT_756076 [Geopyxis carbonaria]|nr:hypothetical protein EDC01DRAFT_756076 [Geopyxis carbonaria]
MSDPSTTPTATPVDATPPNGKAVHPFDVVKHGDTLWFHQEGKLDTYMLPPLQDENPLEGHPINWSDPGLSFQGLQNNAGALANFTSVYLAERDNLNDRYTNHPLFTQTTMPAFLEKQPEPRMKGPPSTHKEMLQSIALHPLRRAITGSLNALAPFSATVFPMSILGPAYGELDVTLQKNIGYLHYHAAKSGAEPTPEQWYWRIRIVLQRLADLSDAALSYRLVFANLERARHSRLAPHFPRCHEEEATGVSSVWANMWGTCPEVNRRRIVQRELVLWEEERERERTEGGKVKKPQVTGKVRREGKTVTRPKKKAEAAVNHGKKEKKREKEELEKKEKEKEQNKKKAPQMIEAEVVELADGADIDVEEVRRDMQALGNYQGQVMALRSGGMRILWTL